jgi:hypothetical protein
MKSTTATGACEKSIVAIIKECSGSRLLIVVERRPSKEN